MPDLNRTPSERVQQAIDAAWNFFTQTPLHQRGLRYLADRGIEAVVLEKHNRRTEVGHTPRPRDGLVRALTKCGFCVEELVDAGLAQRREDGTVTDFYQDRVLLPIREADGPLVGFVGRNIGDARWPKYKNSPRTCLYDKSINLYEPLPPPHETSGRVIIVEGTIDAMAIAVTAVRARAADYVCPITQSGRELSPGQLQRALSLSSSPPVVSFDGDKAGRESNFRLAAAVRKLDVAIAIADLPDGEDPASWIIRAGPSGLSAWIHASPQSSVVDSSMTSTPDVGPVFSDRTL